MMPRGRYARNTDSDPTWYESEESNLGFAFLEQLRKAYNRILNNPLAYKKFDSVFVVL